MKKSAQDKEVEKLKKQVKKLKDDKASLQRDNRNLKGRLNISRLCAPPKTKVPKGLFEYMSELITIR